MFKRVTAIIILLAIAAATAAGCSDNSGDTDNVTEAQTLPPGEIVDHTRDEKGYLKDELPELDFNGLEIGLLYWSDVEKQEYEAAELNGDIVNDAIFARNARVEERLNITFAWHKTLGNNTNRANYLAVVQKSFSAGEKIYDIYSAYSRTIGMLTNNGLVQNLIDMPYLDFDKPWWPDSLLKRITIDGNLYFISGDASTMMLHMMYGVYYNKTILEDYNLPDPIKLVDDGAWTIDKMIELSTGIYGDLNGSGKPDVDDRFGLVTTWFHNDALFNGTGMFIVDQDPEKTLVISPDFTSEKLVALIEKVSRWQLTDDVMLESDNAIFKKGNALFNLNRVDIADTHLRDVDFKYGLVPVPKYDESQPDYVTAVANPISLYAIACDTDNAEIAAAVLECWGSEAYRNTTPALFEINMKIKYSENEDVSRMFDLIRTNVDFELGRIFGADLSVPGDRISKAMVEGTSWSTVMAAYKKQYDFLLNSLVTNLKKYYG